MQQLHGLAAVGVRLQDESGCRRIVCDVAGESFAEMPGGAAAYLAESDESGRLLVGVEIDVFTPEHSFAAEEAYSPYSLARCLSI